MNFKYLIPLTLLAICGAYFLGMVNEETSTKNQAIKVKLVIMQNDLITLEVPIKITKEGVALHFNTKLSNVTDIAVNKYQQ